MVDELVAEVELVVLVELLVLGVVLEDVEVDVGVLVDVVVVVVVLVEELGLLAVVAGQAALASEATWLAPWVTAELRVGSIPPRLAAEFVSVVAA